MYQKKINFLNTNVLYQINYFSNNIIGSFISFNYANAKRQKLQTYIKMYQKKYTFLIQMLRIQLVIFLKILLDH